MPGMGQSLLPKPQFTSTNPYWRVPKFYPHPEIAPRLSAVDFLNASMWEINRRFDTHMAYCVRSASILTVRINSVFGLREQLKKHNLKEIQSEKTV